MTNYTTDTYQIKRDILHFSNKMSNYTRKPTQKLCQDMCYGILSARNCFLSAVARQLKETESTKLNNTVDRLSNNLSKLDKEEIQKIKENYFKEVTKYLPEDYVVVLNDDTELNKEYSKKLEDLCVIKDASSQVDRLVNGYMVCEYAALSKDSKTPISLYSKVYSTSSRTFISENHETLIGENEVINLLEKTKRKPIFVRDRGYDANEYLARDIKDDIKFVTRLKKNRSLLFKDKSRLLKDVALSRKGKIATKLMYRGNNTECYVSYTKVKLPAYKEKEVTLVTIHGLSDDDFPMMLLTNIDVKNKESAEYIVRLYFLRWRVEEYFKAKKAFNWENSLLRTIDSMNNLNLFLTLSMFYLTTIIEKMNTNLLSIIILEKANLLKDKLLVYLSAISTGVFEILKYAKSGIRKWQDIESRDKYRQLCLKL